MAGCVKFPTTRFPFIKPSPSTLPVLIAADAQAANVQNVMGVLFSSTSFQGMFNLVRSPPGLSLNMC